MVSKKPSAYLSVSVTFPIILGLKLTTIILENTLKYFLPFFIIFTSYIFSQTLYQNQTSDNNNEYQIYSDWSLDIPSSTWGISFGNSKNFNGIRFNYRDDNVETINGFNFTLWDAKSIIDSEVNGISLGIMTHASRLNGINIGLGGVIAQEKMRGFNFGLLATISNGEMYGVNFGGLAVVTDGTLFGLNFGGLALVSGKTITGINFGGFAQVADGDITGINLGGLALVSEGGMFGINIGGLANVSKGEMKGINLSLLALVSEDGIKGFNIGGLALVTKGSISGINLSSLALVANQNITGINFGGLAVVSENSSLYGLSFTFGKIAADESIKGISISGYKTESTDFTGINLTLAWTEFQDMHGASLAAYNRINGNQTGLTIGLLNFAENLNGIQIGLINIANNNTGLARILPFVNAHF